MRALPFVLFALSACAAKPTEPPHEAPPPEAPPPPAKPAPPVPAEVLRCGGIAGLRCPLPMVCIDEPDDSCVPGRGADCIGRCVPPEEAPRRPGIRRPVSDDPAVCKGLRIRCEASDVPYSDASGCGCETAGTQRL